MSTRKLPENASLENLRKQAKSLLKSAQNSDAVTLASVKPYFSPPQNIGLQEAQLVVARGYGFSSWAKLKAHLESGLAVTQLAPDQLANEFLRYVVVVYSVTEPADPERWDQARQLVEDHPQIRDENIYTAAALGDVDRVAKWLKDEPALINKKGGYHNWEPLMYAAYSRMPGISTFGVGELLIQQGADPNVYYLWDEQYRFTALTGVFGQGEAGPEKAPEHPEFEKFARLLLRAGANPNDSQAAYNRMFQEDDTCIKLLLEFGIVSTDRNNWLLRENDKLIPHPQETLHYLLCHAIKCNFLGRIKLLVSHGVDVNKPEDGRTPYQLALLSENQAVAEYLGAHGAKQIALGDVDVFQKACLKPDAELATAMLSKNPDLIDQVMKAAPDILEHAVAQSSTDTLLLMIKLGFDVNHETYRTALHQAAWLGRIDMIKMLLASGANPTARDHFYFGPPLAWALQNNQPDAAKFLEQGELDIFTAVALGKTEQLENHIDTDPSSIETTFGDIRPNKQKSCDMDWMTPLVFAVANKNIDSVRCLLDKGANTVVNDGKGLSLLNLAREKADEKIIELIQKAHAK